jgi:5-methylcytosine-specific restriction protein A
MASRLCAEPDCTALIPARPGGRTPPRCPPHQQQKQGERDRVKRSRRPRVSYTKEQRRAAAVAEHRATVGDWCPGVPELGRPAHPTANLTADHVIPVDGRPWLESGPLVVRCVPCNSARGANRTKGIAG